jgi:hypothetical protein
MGQYYRVDSIDVMPEGTVMDPSNGLWDLWADNRERLIALKQKKAASMK